MPRLSEDGNEFLSRSPFIELLDESLFKPGVVYDLGFWIG